jgi:uncharacterized MAPEG superfamily protein
MPDNLPKPKRDYRTLSVRYTPELYALTVITTATALMWVPYVIARLAARGLSAIGNRDPGIPAEPAWAERASRAHANAIENLAVFAPLVLIGAAIGVSTPATVLAAKIFVVARLAHYGIFVAGIPIARTVAFFVGFCATLVIAAALLATGM